MNERLKSQRGLNEVAANVNLWLKHGSGLRECWPDFVFRWGLLNVQEKFRNAAGTSSNSFLRPIAAWTKTNQAEVWLEYSAWTSRNSPAWTNIQSFWRWAVLLLGLRLDYKRYSLSNSWRWLELAFTFHWSSPASSIVLFLRQTEAWIGWIGFGGLKSLITLQLGRGVRVVAIVPGLQIRFAQVADELVKKFIQLRFTSGLPVSCDHFTKSTFLFPTLSPTFMRFL